MAQAVEDAYQWKTTRGLEIVKTAILAIEYDEDTKELMKDVKKQMLIWNSWKCIYATSCC